MPADILKDAELYGEPPTAVFVGEWMMTYTGRRFYVFDPDPKLICIEDIAHHLAMECRYGGAVRRYYSVAEHSVYVSHLVAPELALEGLLHDAAEAYISDMIRPIKHHPKMRIVCETEAQIQAAVWERFGINYSSENERAVKIVDDRIVLDEVDALLPDPGAYRTRHSGAPFGIDIVGYSPEYAEAAFLCRWYELQREAAR